MAIVTVVSPSDVDLVAERDRLHILLAREVVSDRLQYRMTLLTVILYGESILAVMANAAGLTLFHVIHGVAAVAVTGDEGLVVTVVASIDTEMEIVAENSPGIPELDLLHRMTFIAGSFD